MTSRSHPAMTVALNLLVIALACISAIPLVWVLCASLKSGDALFTHMFLPPEGFRGLGLSNYARLLSDRPMMLWIVNSAFLASTHTVIVVILSSLGGFALAKYEFTGKRFCMGLMLVTMLLPGQVILPSLYEMIDRIGWVNSYLGILVPGAVSVFGIFLFKQAMQTVPDELLSAARVDGCSEVRVWWSVALPVVRPMIGAYTLMAFLGTWNSFLWPQLVLKDESKYTLPIGLSNLSSLPELQTDYGVIMAGTIISIAPVMVLFLILQRELIEGLTSGSVKG